MSDQNSHVSPMRYFSAWMVHAFTATSAIAGFLTLVFIQQENYINALWFMGLAVLIDGLDGTFARVVDVKLATPNFDGALLDNIVDYLNYVITPAFFLYQKPDMLPVDLALPIISLIILTSCYQFCQGDAKTPDHFFKGFPCYWNIAVFYMYIFSFSMTTNSIILLVLSILIFVPIKYVYPSRLDYLTKSRKLKILMHSFSLCYGISYVAILSTYPNVHSFWLGLSIAYVCVYLYLSLYRSWYPMLISKIQARKLKSQGMK